MLRRGMPSVGAIGTVGAALATATPAWASDSADSADTGVDTGGEDTEDATDSADSSTDDTPTDSGWAGVSSASILAGEVGGVSCDALGIQPWVGWFTLLFVLWTAWTRRR